MQKLNPKKRFAKIVFALLVVAVVFSAGAGSVLAAEKKEDGKDCENNSQCESGYCKDKKCAPAFEVTLQTPFAKPPDPNKDPHKCVEEDEDRYYTDPETDTKWLCKAKAQEWKQIIVGSDGSEILVTYAKILYKWLAGFIGLVAVLFIIVGGIQISTAGANQEGMQQGKDRIIAALVALTILFLSSLILYTINPTFFGASEQSNETKQSNETDHQQEA